MPTVEVIDLTGMKVGEQELSEEVFGAPDRSYLYGEVIRAQLLSRRKGTASTLTRAEVSYSTKKLFRQKGTGRARRGSRKSPLLRHGGVVFGPKPRDWSIKLPKKVRKLALRSALSGKVREGMLKVLSSGRMEEPKTRRIFEFLKAANSDSALIVDVDNRNLSLSCRNLPMVKYLDVKGLNLFDVLKYKMVFVTPEAVKLIEERLKP